MSLPPKSQPTSIHGPLSLIAEAASLKSKTRSPKGITIATITMALSYAFCWGVGVTLTKIALAKISATTLLIIQLSASVVFLAIACILTDRPLPFSWHYLKQGRAGVFEPALSYMVGIFGVQMTTVSNATLIASSEVILTIVMAAIFLREVLTRAKLILASVSFAGILLLMLKDTQGASHGSITGDLLILLGTVFAVVYALFSKQQIATADPLQLTTAQQWVGLMVTVLCFGILSTLNGRYEVSAVGTSAPFWLLAVGSGILQYALAFLLYLTALQHIPVSQAAFYIALIPVFGVASAMVLLEEQPTLIQGLGGLLVMGSSYWASRLHTV